MWIAPRVQFSGRPSGAPSELDANLIRGHLYPTDNPYPKQPNPRPRTITYFQPFLVQRLGSTSTVSKCQPDADKKWKEIRDMINSTKKEKLKFIKGPHWWNPWGETTKYGTITIK